MPDVEGYTTLLVKTKHDVKIGSVTTQQQLYDAIAANIEEVVLLTQGKYYAKGDGIGKSGALYKTSGTASSPAEPGRLHLSSASTRSIAPRS